MISPFDYDPQYKSVNENRIAELEAEREKITSDPNALSPYKATANLARLSEIDSELQKIRKEGK